MEREGGVSEARTTNRARGEQALEVPSILRCGDTFLPGLGVISGLGNRAEICMLPGKFSLDSIILSSDFFVLCHHDETTKKRPKNSLQLTDLEQKRKRGNIRGKRGENQVFPSHISALHQHKHQCIDVHQ